ncbi:MAG: SAM-dependent chlorinase/fluorinase [Bacteroidota bacterium]
MSIPSIVLLTDFGQKDGFIGTMKGVIQGICPGAHVIDLTHDLPPQSISAAQFVLWNSYKFFPKDTIFCCVVDPGVGGDRPILAVQTEKYVFIAPDNGLLDFVLSEERPRFILRVENPKVMLSGISQTFHGRDIFAPTAAHLAAGFLYTQLGPVHSWSAPTSPFLVPTAPGVFDLNVLHIDHFGNLITNLKLPLDASLELESVTWKGNSLNRLVKSYNEVAKGELLAIHGSHGLLEIACNQGRAVDLVEAAGMKVNIQ